MSTAPDYIEPTVGWRSWLVVREGDGFRLRGVLYDALWPPRSELVACCLRRGSPWRRRREHVAPAFRCRCGIYAARQPEDAASYLEGRGWTDALAIHRVIGTVSLWGQVVECTRGWRASHAYPNVIYVPATRGPYWLRAERRDEVALALTDYGVPVELLDTDARNPEEVAAALGAESAHG